MNFNKKTIIYVNYDIGFNLGYMVDYLLNNFSDVITYKVFFSEKEHDGRDEISYFNKGIIFKTELPYVFQKHSFFFIILSHIQIFLNILKIRMKVLNKEVFLISPNPYFSFFGILLGMRTVYMVGDIMRISNASYVNYLFSTFTAKIVKLSQKRAYGVWYISGSLRNYFKEIKPKKYITQTMAIMPLIKKKKSIPHEIKILYMGGFDKIKGIDLILEAAKNKNDKKFCLIGAESNSSIGKNVKIYKTIIEEEKILNILGDDRYIGLAPYFQKEPGDYLGDPTKIKHYLRYNIPVITTSIVEFGNVLEKYKAGKVIGYNINELLEAIDAIDRDYESYSSGVKKLVHAYMPFNLYNYAFRKLEII